MPTATACSPVVISVSHNLSKGFCMSAFFRRSFILASLFAVVTAPAVARAADDDDDPYFEAFYAAQILSLSSANLTIGITGDAIAKGVYEGDTAVNVANALVQLNESMHQTLVNLAKNKNLEDEEVELLQLLAKAAGHIKGQSDGVLIIAQGGDGKKFTEARAQTEKSLEKAMAAVKEYFAE